ncbi:DUF1836 domain-containing protein [Lactiplantibacillus mudanjiangensis]|uniref:DUF1836 domain-containing protein n=1 Tax=Lactiplantibacillus mudanjiangensis TaxID=1296538 RepID=A0A660E2N3_9LACO|nr:DUF1836 domain-containing protein [Lactiplantibacillus mudanjiangensis]VDG21318.1 hypothetical protein [Lactobacillus pentosus] [Lactiplantibacillus mudanjiangensis]VDG23607.1 hypothetical protein [Lactobacillus pentosus] [Lactiplantibacillus mudanjiangensis]VDG27055.1 hypothetical protein [Lactobacillus pentosus] [Lactiplantibacillus mudanjiangensis]VDG32151.1 hypothetical protein [Lactobacillus pentosus] [Lactiplantibacillus mudanjiangensis]
MTQTLATFKLPAWAELPGVPVYMEQLCQLVNQALAPLGVPEVTKTMVNSYVKQHFFSRPTGRQYTRNQVVAVLVVTLLKQDFNLTTISQAILKIRDSRQIEARYQEFVVAFEQALRAQPVTITTADTTSQAIQFAAQTVAYHLLTQQALA